MPPEVIPTPAATEENPTLARESDSAAFDPNDPATWMETFLGFCAAKRQPSEPPPPDA